MAPKKAAHACLKWSESSNTPSTLGEDRRDGETLFDPTASVQLWADEWDRGFGKRDRAEQPRLCSAFHACRAEAAKAEHARPPVSDGALGSAVALLRNKRGIETDHWPPLELKALPEVAIASLAFILRQIDVQLTVPLQCLTNLICLLPERPIVLQSLLRVLWNSCHADAIRAWDAGRPRFWDSAALLGLGGQRVQRFAVRPAGGDFCKKSVSFWSESTASVHWDLQKFKDDVRPLLILGVECGSHESGSAGPPGASWLEGPALGRCFLPSHCW